MSSALPAGTGPALPSSAPSRAALPFVLEAEGVTKYYGPTRALAGVSISVPPGEIVGLLGPNGAGKSTMMKISLGILKPDGGRIRVFGQDVSANSIAVKRQVGFVPENPQLYEFLTGAEYLDFVADMYGLDRPTREARINQFLSGLELSGHENSIISGYSLGMKQKVALIAALVHRPRLLLLDEPLNGLDPRSARIVKDLLRSLATREGVGVLFSTHVLEIAQLICDRVVIMNRGQVLAQGTVAALRERAGLPGSDLEQVFLALTGTQDLRGVVEGLTR